MATLCVLPWWLVYCKGAADEEPAPKAPTAPALPQAPATTAAEAKPEDSEEQAEPTDAGEWVEGSMYRFRIHQMLRCDGAPESGDKQGEGAAGRTGEAVPPSAASVASVRGKDADEKAPSKSLRVGVDVEIHSKEKELFMTPRGFTLLQGGRVLLPELKPKATEACDELFPIKRIEYDERARGFVVFPLPNESYLEGAKLDFKPPRWGGAPRAQAALPECFGECAKPDDEETASARGSAAPSAPSAKSVKSVSSRQPGDDRPAAGE